MIVHRPGFRFENRRRTIDTVRTIIFLRQKIKQISPDTILSFGEMWNNLVLLSLTGLKFPVYISDRSRPNKNLGWLHNLLRNRLYPKAAGYIAQTLEAEKVCLQKRWNSNIRVIGNPIRKVEQNPAIEKENIVLTVGRLIPTKHIDRLIRIFAEINDLKWKLMIIGGDSLRMSLSSNMNKLVSELKLEESVFLEGEQKEVDSYYNRSKIFAFTSSSEGFPNVIGEAMSAGLPVVAYDCVAGPSDMIINGENGYLIDLFDDNLFKKKLKLLMSDSQLCIGMGEKGKMMTSKFEVCQISEKFYDFITSHITHKNESGITNK